MTEHKYVCMVLLAIAFGLGITSYITSNLIFLLVALGFAIIGAIFGTMYYWYWNNTVSKFFITTSFACLILISFISFTADAKYERYRVITTYIDKYECGNIPSEMNGGHYECR